MRQRFDGATGPVPLDARGPRHVMLRMGGAKCSDIGQDLPPFLFRQHLGDESLRSRARNAIFHHPKQFPILPLFLKDAVREITWRMQMVRMRSRTVAFAANPVTERTPPFAFVERFTR